MKAKVLHVVNICNCSKEVSFCRTLARTFSEFQHEILFLSGNAVNPLVVNWLREENIRCFHNSLCNAEVLKELSPDLICLHDSRGRQQFPLPLNYLNNYGLIYFHHSQTPVFPFVSLDVYMSHYVRGLILPYEACMKEWKVISPGALTTDYCNISPRTGVKKPVIGNIQPAISGNNERLKDLAVTLGQIPEVNFLLVGEVSNPLDNRFVLKSELIGKTATYLSEIDILVVDKLLPKAWSSICVEAMLAAKPIVAMDYGDGIAEQLRVAGGFLTKTKEHFIDILKVLVKQENLRIREGLKLRKWATENACEKTIRKELLNDFLRLL